MVRCTAICVFLLMGVCLPVRAHDVITTKITWSREISRLVYKRCASCHRDGGSSFSLTTYAQARPWAKAIKEETLERRMPPWGAVKGFGNFRDDQGLTQEDLELISAWVEGGAPEGDPVLRPKLPEFTSLHPPKPAVASELVVDGSLSLQAPFKLAAIRPKSLIPGTSMQMVAELPDGSVAPLIWIYDFNPEFLRSYVLKNALNLPAGTKIVCSLAGAGSISLLSQ